jgi:hypothetical protein
VLAARVELGLPATGLLVDKLRLVHTALLLVVVVEQEAPVLSRAVLVVEGKQVLAV